MTKIAELPIPDVVKDGREVLEMARIWLVDGNQIVTLSPRMWSDPGAWGLMLVDLANHVAKAYEARGLNKGEALAAIRSAMDAEWSNPTG
jgi:hypothetical protein